MADHPEAEQSTTADRTSALVAGGLVVLAVLGVATIFSDAITAAWSPSSTATAATATAVTATAATTLAAPAAPTGAGGSS